MNGPEFLKVKPGDTVSCWRRWNCESSLIFVRARDSDAPTLFQVVNVDSGEIKFVHGDELKQILSKRE